MFSLFSSFLTRIYSPFSFKNKVCLTFHQHPTPLLSAKNSIRAVVMSQRTLGLLLPSHFNSCFSTASPAEVIITHHEHQQSTVQFGEFQRPSHSSNSRIPPTTIDYPAVSAYPNCRVSASPSLLGTTIHGGPSPHYIPVYVLPCARQLTPFCSGHAQAYAQVTGPISQGTAIQLYGADPRVLPGPFHGVSTSITHCNRKGPCYHASCTAMRCASLRSSRVSVPERFAAQIWDPCLYVTTYVAIGLLETSTKRHE